MPERHLLMICHGFPPYYGGGEHAAYYLAREAVRSGRWNVSVLTSDIGGRLPPREMMDGMDVIRIPARKKKWAHHTVMELISFLVSSLRFRVDKAEMERPDMILAHFTLPAGWTARSLSKRLGVPYSVVLQGADVPGHRPGRFGLIYPFVKPFVKRVWQQARSVIAVSSPLKSLASDICPDASFCVIPNGVDTEVFCPPVSRPSKNGVWRMVMVGRLEDLKGHRDLFSALKGFSNGADWELKLFGVGPLEGELKDLAKAYGLDAHIHFCGLGKPEEIANALQGADVFVLPSYREGLPLALVEAMACGLPCVTCPVGEIPEVIENGRNGILVSPGDIEAIRTALQRLRDNREEAEAIGKAATATAQNFSWSQLWKEYEALLSEKPR